MKARFTYLIIGLLMISSLQAQIKIGDNPQNLDPSSVLELESTGRVLVITRINNAQMNAITPLRGALVYNTDEECIHYYDGSQWVNICEALDNSFTVTTEAVFNQFSRDSTVVVTQTDTNYNFEVNQITGDNIVDTSINGDVDIQQATITNPLIAEKAISFDKLADGLNTGEILQWNGTEWVLIDETGITITEFDGVIGNEVLDATAGGSLTRSGLGTVPDPYTLDVLDGGIDTDELADGSVTNAKLDKANIPLSGFGAAGADVDLGSNKLINVLDPTDPQDAATRNYVDNEVAGINTLGSGLIYLGDAANVAQEVAIGGDATINNTGILDLATDAVETDEIIDDAVTLPKIADGTAAGQLMQWDGTDWVLVDESALTVTEIDGVIGNEVNNATDATLQLNGTGTTVDPFTLDVAAGGITDNEIADNAVTLPKIADGTVAGQLMQWDGTDWVLVDESSLTITEVDGIIGNEVNNATDATLQLNGTGTAVDPFTLDVTAGGITDNEIADNAVTLPKIADGTAPGQLIQWDGTDWVLVDQSTLTITEADGIVGNEVNNATDATLQLNGTGTAVDPFTLDVAAGGITDNEIADNAVTLPKITDGTAAGQLMQWDGTDWVLVDDSALTITEVDGIVGNEVNNATDATLQLNGTGTAVDPFTLDVAAGGITDNEIADNAVTLPKIADGTAAGQLMQWDGTDWVLVDDSALTITEVDGIVGNEVNNATDATLQLNGTGTAVDPFTLDVAAGGITDNEIADNAMTLPKIADGTAAGQLMQWDGTDWVLVDDSALTITEVDGIVGNEVNNATDATLQLNGSGTAVDPFTLDVAANGITDNEIAANAVTLPKIADGTAAGQLMQWDGANWVLVDDSALDVVDEIILKGQVAAATGVAGLYTINDPSITATSIIQLTVQENNPGNPIMIQLVAQAAASFSVQIYEFILGTPTATNANWQYIVVAP